MLRYGLYGAAFGFIFPLAGTLLDMGLRDLGLSIGGFLESQGTQPLLWIIDFTPIVIGIFAVWVIGTFFSNFKTLKGESPSHDR